MRELSVEEIEEVEGGAFLQNLYAGVVSGLVVDTLQNGWDSVAGRTLNYVIDKTYIQTGCYSNF